MRKILFTLILLVQSVIAQDFRGHGEVSFSFDNYFNSLNYSDTEIETSFWANKKTSLGSFFLSFTAVNFRRDTESSYYNIKELYFMPLASVNNINVKLGYQIYNWSSNEFFKPNDLINSVVYDLNFIQPKKIGEMSLGFERAIGKGMLGVFFFPFVQNNIYPSSKSPYGVNGVTLRKLSLVTKSASKEITKINLQFALRYDFYFRSWDIATFFISHYDRKHPLVGTSEYGTVLGDSTPINSTTFTTAPTIYFFKENVLGINVVKKIENYTLRFEANSHFPVSDKKILTATGVKVAQAYTEEAIGIEYLSTGKRGVHIKYYLEMSFLNQTKKPFLEDASLFQSDYALGVKYLYNDDQDQIISSHYLGDFKKAHQKLFSISYQTNLNQYWKLKTFFKMIRAPIKTSIATQFEYLDNVDVLSFKLSREF